MSVLGVSEVRMAMDVANLKSTSKVEVKYFDRLGRGLSNDIQLKVKRVFDVIASFLAIIVLSPLLLWVAIAIKTTSKGPIFFKQVRWGVNGSTFEVYKFRSMRLDACDASGTIQAVKDDPRVTRVGAWLRKSNLDELPQLYNVLRGDMSLVGPRCHPVGMLAAGIPYDELVRNYHQRHVMRPGISGLAQVRGLRGPTVQVSKARQRIACDLYYVQHYSLLLDIKIIAGTIKNEVFGGTGF